MILLQAIGDSLLRKENITFFANFKLNIRKAGFLVKHAVESLRRGYFLSSLKMQERRRMKILSMAIKN